MITLFQHGEAEPPGFLEQILREQNLEYQIVRLYEGEVLPPVDRSPLIFLGGRMSVNDEADYPFLKGEKELIRRSIRSGAPVLGICLGAQLIASALGKAVYPGTPEKGWCGIDLIRSDLLPGCPDRAVVFHWHNETFDLPVGADLFAWGTQVPNQIFSYKSALAVQFHMEATPGIIADWTEELPQDERDRIRAETSRHLRGSEELCRRLLDHVLSGGA
ncbi:type 1 glutamine amidotransferase [Methanoculleus frigidifontis]|nr:type 1 glutamine amidotransferase [Methanoculleus sp. FWC-SCC1]